MEDAEPGDQVGLLQAREEGESRPLPGSFAEARLQAFGHIRANNQEEVIQLISEHPSLWAEVDEDGHSMLHWAALGGSVQVVQTALATPGVQVDALSKTKQTPFMWACISGHVAIAGMLLEAGADGYLQDSCGATSLILAIQHEQNAIFFLLVSRLDRKRLFGLVDENGCSPVHWAAYKGNLTSLKLLDYFQVDFQVLDKMKMSPLHRCIQTSKVPVFKFLLDKKVDPSQVDSEGRTAMDLAEKYQDVMAQRELDKLLQAEVVDSLEGQELGLTKTWKRKQENMEKKQLAEMRDKAIHNIPVTFWCVSVSLALFQYITEVRPVCWNTSPSLAMIFELLVPLSLGLFFWTKNVDPGKVPPRTMGYCGVEDLLKKIEKVKPGESSWKDVSNLCTTTWVIKGPRTKYCKRTEACVDEFDHFCGWLNTAIGRGNHRVFMVLCMTEVSMQFCHLILLWRAANDIIKQETFLAWCLAWASQYPLMVMLFCLQCFTAPGVLALTVHQLRGIATNMTTNEMMNSFRYEQFWEQEVVVNGQKRKVFKNPFNKGNAWKNCVDFWWTQRRADRGASSVNYAGHVNGAGASPAKGL